MEINKIINDQLTCGKCFKQFGSIQALKKHLEAKKCQGKHRLKLKNNGLVFMQNIEAISGFK